jgi:flagellar biosynthesis protein FliQ
MHVIVILVVMPLLIVLIIEIQQIPNMNLKLVPKLLMDLIKDLLWKPLVQSIRSVLW